MIFKVYNVISLYFSIYLFYYIYQKNESKYVQNQTLNENSFMRLVFYLNSLQSVKCFLKDLMSLQKVQGSYFSFCWKCTDYIPTSEGVYSRNALGKITSKISATIGCINKPCSVLSAPFDLNGNSNIWLCYSYWKNIFVNCNNIIFRLWSFFGIRMSAS